MSKRKLTPREKAEKRRRKKEFMTIFVNGKQKRVRRPETIEGMDPHEFILRNADPIWLHENEMWWVLDQLYYPKPAASVDGGGQVALRDDEEQDWLTEDEMWGPIYEADHAEVAIPVDDGGWAAVSDDGASAWLTHDEMWALVDEADRAEAAVPADDGRWAPVDEDEIPF